jgi:hypothetical protein
MKKLIYHEVTCCEDCPHRTVYDVGLGNVSHCSLSDKTLDGGAASEEMPDDFDIETMIAPFCELSEELPAKVYSLAEAIADICFVASDMQFYSGDSRETIALTIGWAREFEEKYSGVEWGVDKAPDYIDAITKFAENKVSEYRSNTFKANIY